ncbi:MAG TPA: hypothetical protein VMT37_12825 [Solirubrobacterales bacterium]|nr:hypothetical protein [Solirubrobacterales bacterium]
MLVIDVACSDPGCEEEEFQVWTEDLDEAEGVACACGHSVVALRVAEYRPELPIRLTRAVARERRPIAA